MPGPGAQGIRPPAAGTQQAPFWTRAPLSAGRPVPLGRTRPGAVPAHRRPWPPRTLDGVHPMPWAGRQWPWRQAAVARLTQGGEHAKARPRRGRPRAWAEGRPRVATPSAVAPSVAPAACSWRCPACANGRRRCSCAASWAAACSSCPRPTCAASSAALEAPRPGDVAPEAPALPLQPAAAAWRQALAPVAAAPALVPQAGAWRPALVLARGTPGSALAPASGLSESALVPRAGMAKPVLALLETFASVLARAPRRCESAVVSVARMAM